jgi:hypothetical protein
MLQKLAKDNRPVDCFATTRPCTQINNAKSCTQCKKFKLQKPRYGTGFKFPECISKVTVSNGASQELINMLQRSSR